MLKIRNKFKLKFSRFVISRIFLGLIAILVIGILGAGGYIIKENRKHGNSNLVNKASEPNKDLELSSALAPSGDASQVDQNSQTSTAATQSPSAVGKISSTQSPKQSSSQTGSLDSLILPVQNTNSQNSQNPASHNARLAMTLPISLSSTKANSMENITLKVDLPAELGNGITGAKWFGIGSFSNTKVFNGKLTASWNPDFRTDSGQFMIGFENLIGLPSNYSNVNGFVNVNVIGTIEYYGNILNLRIIPMGIIGTLGATIKPTSSTGKSIIPGETFPINDTQFIFNKYYGKRKIQGYQGSAHYNDFKIDYSGNRTAEISLDFYDNYLKDQLRYDDFNDDGSLSVYVTTSVVGGNFWSGGTQSLVIPYDVRQMLHI